MIDDEENDKTKKMANIDDDERASLMLSDILEKLHEYDERFDNIEESMKEKKMSSEKDLMSKKTTGLLDAEVLHGNTFSFFLMGKYPILDCNDYDNDTDAFFLPFWLALVVAAMKFGIYVLVLFNVLALGKDNVFQLPLSVDSWTRSAQVFSTIIVVYTQDDLFDGLILATEGFRAFQHLPNIKFYKYVVSAFFQCFIGLLGIIITFLLVMQSFEVVELLLNFTAMEFVGHLDEAFFIVSVKGFLGKSLQQKTKEVHGVKFKSKKNKTILATIPHLMCLLTLFIIFAVIWTKQERRDIGNNEIVVQMMDGMVANLGPLSGAYFGCAIRNRPKDTGSVVYLPRPDDYTKSYHNKYCEEAQADANGAFYYCRGEAAWVFAFNDLPDEDDPEGYNGLIDPCGDGWTLKSNKPDAIQSDEFDLLSHDGYSWYARSRTSLTRSVLTDEIYLGVLGDQLTVEESEMTDQTCCALHPTGLVFAHPFYKVLQGAVVARRPVFYNLGQPFNTVYGKKDGEFIMFNGLRWMIVKENRIDLTCLDNESFDGCHNGAIKDLQSDEYTSCIVNCINTFDPYKTRYHVHMMSDTMQLKTSGDTYFPTSVLAWHYANGEVQGRKAHPFLIEKSIVEQIEQKEWTLEKVQTICSSESEVLDNACRTEEQIENAKQLFISSSGLQCYSDRSFDGTSNNCKPLVGCDGLPTWIEVVTDNHPEFIQDVSIFYVGNNFEFWSAAQDPSVLSFFADPNATTIWDYYSRKPIFVDPTEVYFDYDTINPELSEWNGTYFIWEGMSDRPENKYRLQSISTCIPKDQCVLVNLEYPFDLEEQQGLKAPGRLKVNVNGIAYASATGTKDFFDLTCFIGNCDQDSALSIFQMNSDKLVNCFYMSWNTDVNEELYLVVEPFDDQIINDDVIDRVCESKEASYNEYFDILPAYNITCNNLLTASPEIVEKVKKELDIAWLCDCSDLTNPDPMNACEFTCDEGFEWDALKELDSSGYESLLDAKYYAEFSSCHQPLAFKEYTTACYLYESTLTIPIKDQCCVPIN